MSADFNTVSRELKERFHRVKIEQNYRANRAITRRRYSVRLKSFLARASNALNLKGNACSNSIACLLILLGFASSSSPAGENKSRPASPQSRPPSSSQLFAASCASCHGLDGRGGERAPDIASRKEVIHLSDAELIRILQAGIPGKGMPGFSSLGNTNLRQLARYVRLLQGKQAETPVSGNPESGRHFFFGEGNCSQCHMINGVGGFIASDLTSYAQNHSSIDIREAIRHSDESLGARAHITKITTPDATQHEGVIRNEDNFSLQLQSLDGAYHLFLKSEVREIERQSKSLMTSDYATRFSAAQLDDLTSFLVSLKSRDRPSAKKPNED